MRSPELLVLLIYEEQRGQLTAQQLDAYPSETVIPGSTELSGHGAPWPITRLPSEQQQACCTSNAACS